MKRSSAERLKQFEEHHKLLDSLKTDFLGLYAKKQKCQASIKDFELTCTLGEGSFGSVILSQHTKTNKFYAIKVLNKTKVIKQRQLEHTYGEKNVLLSVNFPFLINMEYCFKDNCNVYFVLPFVAGGDMFSLLRRAKTLNEKEAKFYAAQVILGVEYLHYMDLLYRDLKPENIVVETNGYIKLTDFGFCKMVKMRTYTLCGTPEYLAPEVILSKGYGKSVDWWSVGIFLYEMIAGYTPFYAEEPMEIYEKISSGKFKFTIEFSAEARDLIKNILEIDLSKRLGCLRTGATEIKMHAWFGVVDWAAIYSRKLSAPFLPKMSSPDDIDYFDNYKPTKIATSQSEKFPIEFRDF